MQCEAGLKSSQVSGSKQFAFVPVARADHVARIDAALRGALTVVVAPAGWGKTVLCAQWLEATAKNVSWLDCRTAEPLQSFASFCQAAFGDDVSARVPDDAVHTRMLEAFASRSDWYYVFDDLDRVPADVREQLGELVEAAPPHIHFLATTRADALFPATSARLAVRDDLAYLLPSDLAFDRDATDALIGAEINRRLTPEEIETLLQRTGGWPAAIRFAAHAARNASDTHSALMQFDGSNDLVRSFCVAEILTPHAEHVRAFLLTTSIPEYFSPALASSLTAREDSAAIVALIDRSELTQRDEQRPAERRYRPGLHEALRAELATADPPAERRILREAAAWHVDRGALVDIETAAEYLIRAEDWPALLAHVEKYTRRMHEQARTRAALRWLLAVPESVRRSDASVTYAEAALRTLVGETLRAEAVLQALGDRRQMAPPERLAAETIRSVWVLGHLPAVQAMDAADDVLRLLREQPDALRYTLAGLITTEQATAIANCVTAWGSWLRGASSDARELLRIDLQTVDVLPMPRLHWLGGLALIEAWSGSSNRALEYVEEARSLGRRVLSDEHPYLAISELANVHVLIERGEHERAEAMLERARRLASRVRFELYERIMTLESAWLAFSAGALEDALALLDAKTFDLEKVPQFAVRSHTMAAAILLALGETDAAALRLEQAGRREDPATLARCVQLELALGHTSAARELVAAWPTGGEFQGELARQLWWATADFCAGETDRAVDIVRAVVRHAEREGHMRLFLEAGPDVRRLLSFFAEQEPSPYVSSLLRRSVEAALAAEDERPLLSAREREVLGFLADRMTYAEIADQLFISQNTVKSHAKSVYTKLGVRGRREATVRARELGLL